MTAPLADRQALYQAAREAEQRGLLTRAQVHAVQFWSHGMGYKRVGAALGISRDAARDRVQRALSTLARI